MLDAHFSHAAPERRVGLHVQLSLLSAQTCHMAVSWSFWSVKHVVASGPQQHRRVTFPVFPTVLCALRAGVS